MDQFDSVQWDKPPQDLTEASPSISIEPQADRDQVDIAENGPDGILECSVDSPIKENDGTKDAYVSYLVTTHVCYSSFNDQWD